MGHIMQFFARIMAQMLQGPLGEKLANAQWMQTLARNTHKAMEKGGKMAAEQKTTWEQSQKLMRENAQKLRSDVKSDVNNSFISQYYKGVKEEFAQLKQQLKEETSNQTNKKT